MKKPNGCPQNPKKKTPRQIAEELVAEGLQNKEIAVKLEGQGIAAAGGVNPNAACRGSAEPVLSKMLQ